MTQLALVASPRDDGSSAFGPGRWALLRHRVELWQERHNTAEEYLRRTERKFLELADRWRAQTAWVSSSDELVDHAAYQEIIAMGWIVVPLILRELSAEPDHWATALAAITGEDLVSPDLAGDVAGIARVWLEWGRSRGLV